MRIRIIYKGKECPLWGGVSLFASPGFWQGGMEEVSITIRAEKVDAGIVVLYED